MENRNLVNLNVNPCKMCMPMGAVTAIKGIENSMMILHGSQGCSTYIRRHMAGHYNEPIDVASSSLNEEGTVYGGEGNLKKALGNVIKLYNPEFIGVATTCLAETIGEDVKRIVSEFVEGEKPEKCRIVTVQTPGYGGSQFEGYFAALTAVVREISTDDRPNGRINIIAAGMNPGDIRNVKAILAAFDADYILLPDISGTLDAPYSGEFRKIPEGGTGLGDIKAMAGASATIELGVTVPENLSPGAFLNEKYGVPLYRCPLPIGIKNTDLFVGFLCSITCKPVPDALKEERGRLVDGMIDSHKYNGEGRAVIFGEPELVFALASLCVENGVKPVLMATGARNKALRQQIEGLRGYEAMTVLDETDFDTILDQAVKLNANLLIGNSDGKVITEKAGIPLVRAGFPIHDRVGGQRLAYTGYAGTLKLLDDITNTLLESKHEKYRESMYEKYFKPEGGKGLQKDGKPAPAGATAPDITAADRTAAHPCFSAGACRSARMHIPVAPACNITCNYCNRKYDCVNESRPGVTSEILTPEEAAAKFRTVASEIDNLRVVGIAGPGDALANFDSTKRSIELIKEIDPGMTFCLSTNGLMLPFYAEEIIKLGVTHVTVTINAISPAVGARIYRDINYLGTKLTGRDAAEVLIRNQLTGLKYLSLKGVVCKVNIVMIKGVNDGHIEEVVRKVKECGAYMTNIMPLIPAKGSAFENMPLTNNKELNSLRKRCECDLKQMYHCRQCRADAIGPLENDVSSAFRSAKCGAAEAGTEAPGEMLRFAVATRSGMLVDQHFGHVEEFYIYEYSASGVRFAERRAIPKYCGGQECENEDSRLDRIIKAVEGCGALIVLRIGYGPMKSLEERNIKVIQTCDRIEAAVVQAAEELLNCGESVGEVV